MLYEIEHNYSQNLQLMSKCCTSKVILLVEKVKILGTREKIIIWIRLI